MTSPTHYSDHPAAVASTATLEHVQGSYERVSNLIGKTAGVERAFDAAVAASATLRGAENVYTRASDLIGKTAELEEAMDAAMAASAVLNHVERSYASASGLLTKAAGVERAMDAAMATSAALGRIERTCASASGLLDKAVAMDTAMDSAMAVLNHVERSDARTTSILRAVEGIDAALRTSTMSIGAAATQCAPSDLAARPRMTDAVLNGPALMPAPDHDIESVPAETDDTDGRLLFLLACMVSLIVLLVIAQAVDPDEVIPQTRLWVSLLGNKVLHSAEFNGWLVLFTVVMTVLAVRKRR